MTQVLTTTEDTPSETPSEPPPAPTLRLTHSTFRAAMAALAAAGYAYDSTVRLWLAAELHPASIERRTYDTPEDARLGRRSARPYVIVVHEPPAGPDSQEPAASELGAPAAPIPSEPEA